MLSEALEAFKAMLDKDGDRIILDMYVPKDGTYRIIELKDDGSYEILKTLDIRYNKKERILEGREDPYFGELRFYDYNSKLLDMNKPVDSKKIIHSDNYLSLAVKKESIKTGKLTAEILEGYYETLKHPETKYKKKNTAKLYESVVQKFGEPDSSLIDRIKDIVFNGDIWSGIDLDKNEYAKIFFVLQDSEETHKLYEAENDRYIIPNIYNNNDFNVIENKNILGIPNNNMGMNSKKPFLEHKSRKETVPFFIDQETVLLQNRLFDYMSGLAARGKLNVYISNDPENRRIIGCANNEEPDGFDSGYYLRLKKGKEVEIHEASVVTHYDPLLERHFVLKNAIELSDKALAGSKLEYNLPMKRLFDIRNLINGVFFEGKLEGNMFNSPEDISVNDGVLKECIIESSGPLRDWYMKGNERSAVQILEIVSEKLIINSILEDDIPRARRQINLRCSLKDYFNNNSYEEKKMKSTREIIREKINGDGDIKFDSEAEFGYAVGQMVSYLVSLSKSMTKPSSLINPFLKAKNHEVIKTRLRLMYMKYNYSIDHPKAVRAERKLYANIMDFEPKGKPDTNMISAGFAADSLIYEKKADEKDDE